MSPAFARVFPVLIGEEGGFSDYPADPGNWAGGKCGAGTLLGTMWGISAPMLVQFFPGRDPRSITLAEAQAFYEAQYWQAVQGDALPLPVALVVFDAAVNNNPLQSRLWLQAALAVRQDGVIGPFTLSVARAADPMQTVAACLAERIVYMAALPDWPVFGLGWARRLARLLVKAVGLAA